MAPPTCLSRPTVRSRKPSVFLRRHWASCGAVPRTFAQEHATARAQEVMMANPLVELQRLGQSPWHDNISRGLLTSGKLKKMVRDGDITGLTSNPTIFEQAIAQSK